MVLARFDAEHYDRALFERAGLRMPLGVDRMARRRQAHFLAGRMVAARALSAVDSNDQHCGLGAAGEPLWPTGVTGSISHTDDICGAIACRDPRALCGLDLERIASGSALQAIFKTCLSDAEAARVKAEHWLPAPVAATALFSAKETLYKALFPRVHRYFGFEAAEAIDAPARGKIRLRLNEDLSLSMRRGRVFQIDVDVSHDHVRTVLIMPGNLA